MRGATAGARALSLTLSAFQSTLPVRGATLYFDTYYFFVPFQSTLPVRGATLSMAMMCLL